MRNNHSIPAGYEPVTSTSYAPVMKTSPDFNNPHAVQQYQNNMGGYSETNDNSWAGSVVVVLLILMVFILLYVM